MNLLSNEVTRTTLKQIYLGTTLMNTLQEGKAS